MSKLFINQSAPTGSLLSQLPYVLTWRSCLNFPLELYNSYLRYLDHAIERWLSEVSASDTKTIRLLSDLLRDLPEDSRRRLLTAPETYRKLTEPEVSEEAIAFFYDSIRAERYLIHLESHLEHPVWTALGDFYFPAGSHEVSRSSANQTFSFEPSTLFRAPRVAARMAVDGVSPFSELHIPGYSQEITFHTADELEFAFHHLTEAFGRVCGTSSHVADVIALLTKVIVVRKDLAAPDGFGSSSWSTFIGKTAMTNAHLEDNELSLLANALIHEAIHSLLYITELVEPFYNDRSLLEEYTMDSPWTGHVLYLHSYIHACFVWFGLWCFWSLASGTQLFSQEEINKRIQRSSSGFGRSSLLYPLTKIREHLKPQLLDTISQMQELVIAH